MTTDNEGPEAGSEQLASTVWHEGLPAQHRVFVEEYCKDFNGAAAARRANYSEHTAREQASRLLTSVNIQKALKAYLAERAMSAEEAKDNLSTWGRGSLAPFLMSGEINLDSPTARENIKLLKKVKQTKTTRQGEDFYSETVRTEIEIHDPMAASVRILEMDGKFIKKVEIGGPNGGPIPIDDLTTLTDDELRRRIAALRTGTVPPDSGQEESA